MYCNIKLSSKYITAGFFFSAGQKEGEWLAKTETAVLLSKLGFLS